MPREHLPQSTTPLLLASSALIAAVCIAGCYKKVVNARGFGADTMTVERGNLPPSSDRISGYRIIEPKQIPPKQGPGSTMP